MFTATGIDLFAMEAMALIEIDGFLMIYLLQMTIFHGYVK